MRHADVAAGKSYQCRRRAVVQNTSGSTRSNKMREGPVSRLLDDSQKKEGLTLCLEGPIRAGVLAGIQCASLRRARPRV